VSTLRIDTQPSQDIEARRRAYTEKVELRLEGLRARAAKRRADGEARIETAEKRAAIIPLSRRPSKQPCGT
jgi:hypothetical protein